ELLVEARWPVAPPRSGAAVEELAYRHGDYAVVGVAAQVSLAADDTIAAAHLGLFGGGATPVRPRAAGELPGGGGPAAGAAGGQAAQGAVDRASDATASAAYRREMVAVFVRRALASAYARARDASAAP